MSFIAELQRRNVIRMAFLYLVASWVILQVADVVFPVLDVPDWGLRLVLGLLVVCFPLALIFSWIYEMTPEGLKREKDIDRSQSVTADTGRKINLLIVVLLVVAILVVVTDRLIPEDGAPRLADADEATQTATPTPEQAEAQPDAETRPEQVAAAKFLSTAPEQSVAVLPFVNMSGDPDNEYFSDGLSEELLNALAGIPGLFVAARTSSFHFKGSTGDIADIARQLRVRNVLEGSVRSSGGRVRITAQLIDASNGYHLWSDTFDRTLDDVFAVQDEISLRVAEALKVTLLNESDAAPDRPTDNTEAYLAYLRGQQYSNEGGVKGYTKAIEEYQRAVTLDPDFAEAYAGIAMAWAEQLGWGNLSRAEAAPRIREAADRALAIDSNLPLAWTADAVAIYHSGPDTRDDPRVLATLERALAMEPGNVVILSYYAAALGSADRQEEAIEALQKGLARDPLSAVLHNQLGGAYLAMGQTDKARRSLLTALELKPGLASAADGLASVARQRSQFAESIIWQQDVIATDPRDTYSRSLVSLDYLELDDLQRAREWQAVADEMDAEAPMSRGSRALLLWFEGDTAAAAAEARRYFADGLKGSGGVADPWMRYVLFYDRLNAGEPQAALDILLNGETIPAAPLPGTDISFRDAVRLARALPALALTEGTAVAQSKAEALLAYADREQGQPGWSPGRIAILRCSLNRYLGRAADAIRACEQELISAGMGTYLGLRISALSPALAGSDEWRNFMDRIRAERAAQLATLRESGKEPTPH